MKVVITYGTFDLLHQGHLNLLKKAKELGDYLIVGVTNDSFDRDRGKLNVRNNVLERVDAVKSTGLVDKVIIEEYWGQKIDDIQKYNVSVFAIGSDWEGQFDYLKEYCDVVYLPRTQGISSTQLRNMSQEIVNVGIVGCGRVARRFPSESSAVTGVRVAAVYDVEHAAAESFLNLCPSVQICDSYDSLLDVVDAVYVSTPHLSHYDCVKKAIKRDKHVLCETPLVLEEKQAIELFALAESHEVVLLEANKTAHCPAFNHLMLMIKSGIIGEIVDIEASLSQLLDKSGREFDKLQAGGAMYEQGSYPLLPIFRLLGTGFKDIKLYSRFDDGIDVFTRGVLLYDNAVASFKVGLGVKTEGNLIVSGTKGYAYVPAPWWKTDFFEFRFENPADNKKFFYKWDGFGLRYEIQEFISCIINRRRYSTRLTIQDSIKMARIMQELNQKENGFEI